MDKIKAELIIFFLKRENQPYIKIYCGIYIPDGVMTMWYYPVVSIALIIMIKGPWQRKKSHTEVTK